ncbi:TPA: hypothetical protein ACX6R9_002737 [Photobacterium damselae]
MKYAPIVIATYNRFFHFTKCIESLKKNDLATFSTIIIGIDFPISEQHIEDNNKIKHYCRNLTGFKSIIVKEWTENLGPRGNFQELRKIAFKLSDSIILTEDDNVFHPDFLSYMNFNLNKYKTDDSIFSVCGYNYPIDYKNTKSDDNILLKAYSAWGVGIWKHKFCKVEFKQDQYSCYLKSPLKILKVSRALGDHVLYHYFQAVKKKLIYGDTWISLFMYRNNQYSVFPVKTLVENIGNDGTGVNCSVNDNLNSQKMLVNNKTNNIYHIESTYHREQINTYFRLPAKTKLKFAMLLLSRFFYES